MERIREGLIGIHPLDSRDSRSGPAERWSDAPTTQCVEKGNCGILGGDPLWIKSIEHVNLDGVPDPLSALGWDVSKALPPAAS